MTALAVCPRCNREGAEVKGFFVHTENNTCCDIRTDFHIANFVAAAGIPKEYQGKNLDEFDIEYPVQAKILESLKKYVEEWPKHRQHGTNITLISKSTRVGKTHLACGLARAIIEKYQSKIENQIVQFINISNWSDDWKQFHLRWGGIDKDDTSGHIDQDHRHEEVVALCERDDKIKLAPLLVMDDFGEPSLTENQLSRLYAITDYRAVSCLSTIVTMNMTWLDAAKKYGDDGERIVARLSEKADGFTFSIDEEMKKKKKGK